MGEKKDHSGTAHDVDAFPTWSDSGTSLDGNIVTWFLGSLNDGSGFAGHTDWRLPNQFELYTLIDFGKTNPVVDAAFHSNCTYGCTVLNCSCTRSDWYGSSTTDHGLAAYAVNFTDGSAAPIYKSQSLAARAVRNAN